MGKEGKIEFLEKRKMKTSIVNLNKVKESSKQFRFDAEYFKPEYLLIENKIKASQYHELRNCISILTDYHANGSYETLRNNVTLLTEKNYAYMIRTVDFESDDYETDVIYVDEHAYNFLSKSKVFGTEVIINKIGNAGKVYIVPPLKRIMTLGMNQFMIRSNKKSNNHFLYVYLTCKYGNLQLEQRVTGAVPLSIDKESVKSVLIPALNPSFQDFISSIIKEYFDFIGESKKQYKQAEQILLSELDLLDWKPKHHLSFVRNFSDTKSADRIDAEYFQPVYVEADKHLIEKFNAQQIGLYDFVDITTGQYIEKYVEKDQGKPYIRGTDLSKGSVNLENLLFISKSEQISGKKAKEGDVVVTRVGTIGASARIPKECEDGTISDNLIRIRLKTDQLNSYYLALYFDSILGKSFMIRNSRGSVQQRLNQETLKEIFVPILPEKVQYNVADTIIRSHELRTLAKKLIDIAKRGVELAIEENEQSAEKWIKRELDKLGVET